MNLVLISSAPLHGAVAGLHESYRRLLPAWIGRKLDDLSLLGLNDLRLCHGLYYLLSSALGPLGLDLGSYRLLTVPLTDKLEFGFRWLGLSATLESRLLRDSCLLSGHLLLLHVYLLNLHKVYGLVVCTSTAACLNDWLGIGLSFSISIGSFRRVLITIQIVFLGHVLVAIRALC